MKTVFSFISSLVSMNSVTSSRGALAARATAYPAARRAFPALAALAAFVAVTTATAPAHAYEVVNTNTVRVRILSYNIKGLPALLEPTWDQERFKDIGEILAARRKAGNAPDIVLLQESFSDRTLDLQKAAGYPYVAQGPSNQKIISSGLYILSEFPITYKQGLLYDDLVCGTWDCFASKGALAVRIQMPKVPFQMLVATTHAQSGKDWNSQRRSQLEMYADFLKSLVNPDLGVITGGDFNTQPARPSYHDFLKRTGFTNVGETCLSPANRCNLSKNTNRTNLLDDSDDQVYFQSGKRVSIRPIAVARILGSPYKGRVLSDHLGYETIFEITWR
jgi:endonuclease/exonuclease/phosphatase family metal-dependent hydrolase